MLDGDHFSWTQIKLSAEEAAECRKKVEWLLAQPPLKTPDWTIGCWADAKKN